MDRIFNTSGLCFPKDHYTIDPLRRLKGIQRLIDKKKYFVIHAPRQTGKTTAMRALMEKLNREGKYIALHFSCETASVTGEEYGRGNRIIVDDIIYAAKMHLPKEERPTPLPGDQNNPDNLLQAFLSNWASEQTKPIVLLIDEIDSLSDLTLISILRQLRNGFQNRPEGFPQSVALIGLKEVRDYKVKVRDELKSMGTASPFNIKDRSLTLRNFTQEEVSELYQQHTDETGQPFTEEAQQLAFEYSQGQPWLVNSIARECVEEKEENEQETEPITEDDIIAAREMIIQRRETHLDSLLDKLTEKRVQRIIIPMIAGEYISDDITDDDLQYVKNLGLITQRPSWKAANPIYQEIIPRALNFRTQGNIPDAYDTWLDEEGKLDWPKIWDQFLEFWREHGGALIGHTPYHEIAPHLVCMAYLQRIANSKGQVLREYAIGLKRLDLLVRWPYEKDGKRIWQKEAIELKVWKPSEKDPLEKALKQLDQYLNGLSKQEGTLVIFDRREGLPDLEERVSREFLDYEGKQIQLIRA